jgi:glycogen phosphorylase
MSESSKDITKTTLSRSEFKSSDAESLKKTFINRIRYSLAKDEYSASDHDAYKALAYTVRDRLVDRWIETQQAYYKQDAKRVYYLSMEFLTGRALGNAIINLDLNENTRKMLLEFGYKLEDLEEMESDAGLGNGGLGRLAACFMDSMSTLELPCYGYGIRYEYGIFHQHIKNGYQTEAPDNWLRYGNPWEIERPERLYPIRFGGYVQQFTDERGEFKIEWKDAELIMAMAYDTPVPGYQNNTVNNLRLWSAKSAREFNFDYFNHGDYGKAVADKVATETISKVLYPNDATAFGKELRLKQEYFFVSATLQDIIYRYKKNHTTFDAFSDKVAIQLNDTHPAIAVAELMRLLIDFEGLAWEKAWEITVKTMGYTNHTVLPEALERWAVSLMDKVLPRHLQIIYEINRRFLEDVKKKFPNDPAKLSRVSIIEEGQEKMVRMANLAIIGSHSLNGVAALHSDILKKHLFKDFYDIYPERFNNKTNGITQRRWLKLCNPELAELITRQIGDGWTKDLSQLKALEKFADDADFQKQWQLIKHHNKEHLVEHIKHKYKLKLNADALFDVQIKRIHEYKRQLLNALHIIHLYSQIKKNPNQDVVPRVLLFAGKAAPGYFKAKLIIKLINSIASVVNNDREVGDKLKVLFLENYSVSYSQKIIPAADLSEQTSTAGMEASGTGNMKFALNGALTIGTLDGATIEIKEEVGDENIFIFGLTADEVAAKKKNGYNPRQCYAQSPHLKNVLDMIAAGTFASTEPALFKPILESLLDFGDNYMVLADFDDYVRCQERVSETFKNKSTWTKMAILNVARMGKFSTDRTIQEYARDIWHVNPIHVEAKNAK